MPMMHGLIRAVGDYRLATRLDTALEPIRQKQFGHKPIKIERERKIKYTEEIEGEEKKTGG